MEMKKNVPEISQVEIIPFRPRNGLLGFASCIINNQFFIGDIAFFSRPAGGIRLGFPEKKLSNGAKVDIFKPLTSNVDAVIESAVMERYEQLMKCNETGGNEDGFSQD